MHFSYTVRTPAACESIRRNLRPLQVYFFKAKRTFAKSTSKVTDGEKISKSIKPAPTIVIPPSDHVTVKKIVSIWDNIPGSEKLIQVTDSNFEEIIKIHKSLLVMFYGSWCSVCKDVNIEVAKAAAQLSPGEGSLGICDAMDNVKLVDKYLIKKTPSLKYFKNGLHVADYIGKPLAQDIIMFMKNPPTLIK